MDPGDAERTAEAFATRFLDRSFEAATDLLAGGDAVLDPYPEGFQEESTTAAEALESYWWGLHGQYGPPEGAAAVAVEVDAGGDATATESDGNGTDPTATDAVVTVDLTFESGIERARIGVADHGIATDHEVTTDDAEDGDRGEGSGDGRDVGPVTTFAFDPAYEVPAYVDRAAVSEREVTVDAGDTKLEGILVVPGGDGDDRDGNDGDASSTETGNAPPGGPVPGMVLVHGAGVHDPDGSDGASKLLRDLAWGLATRGVATLRYEKRPPAAVPEESFTLDRVVVDDAVAAIDRLAAAEAVDDDALFVAGHSQGGMAAPRIADRHGDPAGVAVLDGSPDAVLDPEDADVIRYEFDVEGDLTEAEAAEVEAARDSYRQIRAGEFDDDETIMGRPGVWFRSLLDYDPTETASDLDAPAFVATTFRADEHVQPHLAAFHRRRHEAWEDADLPAGSRVVRYDGLDHFLQPGYAPSHPLALYFGGNVSKEVVADLAEWIDAIGE